MNSTHGKGGKTRFSVDFWTPFLRPLCCWARARRGTAGEGVGEMGEEKGEEEEEK